MVQEYPPNLGLARNLRKEFHERLPIMLTKCAKSPIFSAREKAMQQAQKVFHLVTMGARAQSPDR